MTFTARWPGRCAACEDRIHEGDQVTYVDDELVHTACDGPALPNPRGAPPLCNECFTQHRGECL